MKALWRQIEEMQPLERRAFLGEVMITVVTQRAAKLRMAALREGRFRPFRGKEIIETRFLIPHTPLWIKARTSFYKSAEWKTFRQSFLEQHPQCARCGAKAQQVHHVPPFNLDATVIKEGFLEGLKHPDRFESICLDCHEREHEDLIKSEIMTGSRKGLIKAEERIKK
jgi:hypothetical protein